ncbi:putative multidrug ABC transporter permease YbhS [Thermoflexales bacterium]|nr:putative multidrug ABC transporter permease YbhS [Thermoflexales bacterium]
MIEFFRSIFRSIIRTLAFPRKEIVEVLRQPRLVVTLILGPFLILLVVGLGYRSERPPLRTLFVMAEDNSLKKSIEDIVKLNSMHLDYLGSTSDQASALQQLHRNEVDLVVIAPERPDETIQANQQATFTVYHREIDPTQAAYVTYLARAYVEEANRELLRSLTLQGQSGASDVEIVLTEARQASGAWREAVQRRDDSAARQQHDKLQDSLGQLEVALGTSLAMLGNLSGTPTTSRGNLEVLRTDLNDLRQNTESAAASDPGAIDVQKISAIEAQLVELETTLEEFQQLDSQVLVSPFRSEAKSAAAVEPRFTDFFAPAVLILLLQHLIVTFAALSLVRDRRLGIVEVFRSSPVSSLEILVGKYLSYLLLGGFLAALLTFGLVYLLRVPMLGRWPDYIATVTLVLFAALGIGFVISLLSQTDSQAVQYSMIILLASVFLSGFLMNLLLLQDWVRVISWSLPATYGIALLQNVALRGEALNPLYLAGLGLLGVSLFLVAYLLLRKTLAAR